MQSLKRINWQIILLLAIAILVGCNANPTKSAKTPPLDAPQNAEASSESSEQQSDQSSAESNSGEQQDPSEQSTNKVAEQPVEPLESADQTETEETSSPQAVDLADTQDKTEQEVKEQEAVDQQSATASLPAEAEPDLAAINRLPASTSLENELEKSLQDFDEKLLDELEQTRQRREELARQKAGQRSDQELAEGEQANDGGEVGEEGEQQAAAGGQGEEGEENQQAPAGTVAGNTQDSQTAKAEHAANSTIDRDGNASPSTPADIPSGADDDVVARQLREAAEAETDPVVKEKLWDEYRKYKNIQTANNGPSGPK